MLKEYSSRFNLMFCSCSIWITKDKHFNSEVKNVDLKLIYNGGLGALPYNKNTILRSLHETDMRKSLTEDVKDFYPTVEKKRPPVTYLYLKVLWYPCALDFFGKTSPVSSK